MIFIVDNVLNYIIYIFICSFGYRYKASRNNYKKIVSFLIVIAASIVNIYLGDNNPLVYLLWSVFSIYFLYENSIGNTILLSFGLIVFTGIIDTFSVMLIQVVYFGAGIDSEGLSWWMEFAYLISLGVYALVYVFILKKNEVYLVEVKVRYKLALLIQMSIFQLFYNLVFSFFNAERAVYSLNAYVTFVASIFGVYYSIFVTMKLAVNNIVAARQNIELQKYMKMQSQQYEYQARTDIEIRKLSHDISNHIGALYELINLNKFFEAKEYIDSLWNRQTSIKKKLQTGDEFLNVLVNNYAFLAEERGVTYTLTGRFSEPLRIELIDVTSMVGNVLQNALEGVNGCANSKIIIELGEDSNELYFIVENTIQSLVAISNNCCKTNKLDVQNHGFGLRNIKSVVKKYCGEYVIKSFIRNNENWFSIMLIIPKEKGSK